MNWILKIAPKKLREIDTKLRENYPSIWATRIHLTLYFGIILSIITALIGAITPVTKTDVLTQNDIESFFFILLVPTVIFTGYILIQIVLYNIEKRNGITKKSTPWITFPLTFISLLIPFLMPLTNSMVTSYKTANLSTDQEIIEARNDLHKAEYFINGGAGEYHYNPVKKLDHQYRNHLKPLPYMYSVIDPYKDSIYYDLIPFPNGKPRLKKDHVNLGYFSWELHHTFPIVSLDSMLFDFYEDQNEKIKRDSAVHYLKKAQNHLANYSFKSIKADSILYELENRIYFNTYSAHEYYTAYNSKRERYIPESAINSASSNVRWIIAAKNNWIPDDLRDDFFPGLYIFLLCLTTLVFVFKWVTWQQFLLNFFITGLYLTITAIVADIYRWYDDFFVTSFLIFMLLNLILMHRVWYNKRFSVFTNQLVINSIYIIPFFPLFVFQYLKSTLHVYKWPYFDKYKITKINHEGVPYLDYSSDYYEMLATTKFWCFYGGIAFFLIVGLPYFYAVFKRLRALPKRK